jgi:hypothetical protein
MGQRGEFGCPYMFRHHRGDWQRRPLAGDTRWQTLAVHESVRMTSVGVDRSGAPRQREVHEMVWDWA